MSGDTIRSLCGAAHRPPDAGAVSRAREDAVPVIVVRFTARGLLLGPWLLAAALTEGTRIGLGWQVLPRECGPLVPSVTAETIVPFFVLCKPTDALSGSSRCCAG